MTKEISLEVLRGFGRRAYTYAGLTEADAATVVEVQLDADLRGVDTHGFQRLSWYLPRLRSGENKARPATRVVKETASSLAMDVDNGLGQLVCVRAMEMLLRKAGETGLAVGTLKNSNDWGCAAYYPKMAAEQGYVAFGTTTSPANLAPFGAVTRRTGNNPMVYAVPRRAAPALILDMALTPVALGKVMRARNEGLPIPLEWGFRDREGRPTTDPVAAREGVIPAIGGYKGIGLSVMMNVLAGVLPGGFHTSDVGVGRRGQFFLVMSPELFDDRDHFLDEIERMVEQIKTAERLPGVDEVYLPGEIEQRQKDRRLARGAIEYPPSVVADLKAVGEEIGVPFPA